MISQAALRYTAPVLVTGIVAALASKLLAGWPGAVLLIGGCALLMAGSAVMAVACGLDAVTERRRERSRS
jgi:hypothetical protein